MNQIESSGLNFARTMAALFLVAGTCIGGGMLALPVATGMSGFLPSIAMMTLCWISMTLTALLLLEVSMWMEDGVHLISMTSRILGMPGKVILMSSNSSVVSTYRSGSTEVATCSF